MPLRLAPSHWSLAALILALVLMPVQALANRGESWVRIAVKQLDTSSDTDLLDLARAPGSFKAFRLQAGGATINITRLQINYADGTSHTDFDPILLRRGGRSKPIDARDEERFADTMSVSYDKIPRGRAVLEVWGLQSRAGRSASREEFMIARTPPPLPGRVSEGATEPAGDVLIGVESVGFGTDEDEILVGKSIGKFARLRLRVRDNDIFLTSVRVVYADGSEKPFAVEERFDRDAVSIWFDIDPAKFVEKVVLSYRSKPGFAGQARVELFAKHSAEWLKPGGEGASFNDGWLLLGAQSAGFIGFDDDVIPVGEHQEGFQEVRVNVRNRAVTLNQLRIVYGNGEEDIVPVASRIGAGSSFGPVEVRKDSPIREIRARYRSRVIDPGAAAGMAVVEVWARR